MNSLFKEVGLLSEQGEQLVLPIKEKLEQLFSSEEVKNLNDNQVRILGSNLSKMIGDKISYYLTQK